MTSPSIAQHLILSTSPSYYATVNQIKKLIFDIRLLFERDNQQTAYTIYFHYAGVGWHHKCDLSFPVKYFTEHSMAVLLSIICVIYVLCLSCFRVCSLLPCGYLLGKD